MVWTQALGASNIFVCGESCRPDEGRVVWRTGQVTPKEIKEEVVKEKNKQEGKCFNNSGKKKDGSGGISSRGEDEECLRGNCLRIEILWRPLQIKIRKRSGHTS